MDNPSSSGGGLLLGLFTIFLLGLAVVFGSGAVKNVGIPSGANLLQSGPPATGSSIVGGPSISAQKVDTILSNAGSPAAGTGQTFYSMSVKYQIDNIDALAFFKHESSFGTTGEAVRSLSIGNLICVSQGYEDLHPWCPDGYTHFPSWQAGIEAWYRLIRNVYV